MDRHKQLLALRHAAKKQTDPVKKARIIQKIKDIERNIQHQKWLAQ